MTKRASVMIGRVPGSALRQRQPTACRPVKNPAMPAGALAGTINPSPWRAGHRDFPAIGPLFLLQATTGGH